MIIINILESVCLALEEADVAEETQLPPERPDCEHCRNLKGKASCANYATCSSFRAWFKYEWDGIREAAKRLKEGNGNG